MEIILVILLIVVIAGIVTVIIMLNKNKPVKDDQALLMLQNQLNELSKALGDGLSTTHKTGAGW